MFYACFAACAIGLILNLRSQSFKAQPRIHRRTFIGNKMNKKLFHLPENLTSQARNAFRLMLVLIGVSSAFLVFIGFQIFQTPSWQCWLLASEAVILLILEFRALALVRRGRHELGILIVLAPIQLMLIITP